MSLFDIFRPNSVIEATVTGAAVGAFIGDKLDERADRGHIIQLLEAQLAQRNYHYAMDELLRPVVDLPGLYDNWYWMWDPPGVCAKFHVAYLYKVMTDQASSAERTKLYLRWRDIRERALAVGVIPSLGMPRTVSGDIAGTPESLSRAMDDIDIVVVTRERENQINKKWGI